RGLQSRTHDHGQRIPEQRVHSENLARHAVPIMKRRILMVTGALALVGLAFIPAASTYYTATWGGGCARCHEIRENLESWRSAVHRGINCTACHESGVRANLRRVVTQWFGAVPEQ